MKGLVVKTTGLWHEVLANNQRHIARLRGKFKLQNKKITNPIAVGDWVEIESTSIEDEWMINEIGERRNYVARLSPRKKGHSHLIASNVDQALVFFTFQFPRTSIGFIDRTLVTLEAFRIPALIFLNKTDLCSQEELENWDAVAAIYSSIGYEVLSGSLEPKTVDFQAKLDGKTSLLIGHSGTGKSTLINQLITEAKQEVNEVSTFANKGTHTTTFAEMFFGENEVKLIDTPGIKELGLAEIESAELSHYFPEMRNYLGKCKFHNCTHVEEPGCLIKKMVEQGEIAYFRYDSYLSMLYSEDNRR